MNTEGTQVSKKRQASSPVVGKDKERRENEEETETSIEAPKKSQQLESKMSTTSKDSYASAASGSNRGEDLEKPTRQSVFTTSKPEGAFRDEIVVELQTLDDQAFRGTITLKEARKKIFEEILGFKQEDLSGLIFGYSGCPIVTFKLFAQFNIDTLENFQFFELERKYKVRDEERLSRLKCKIRGIRTEQRVDGDNYKDEGYRWVKVEGCEYRIEKDQILEWLSHFGEVKSDLSEDMHGGSDDSDDDLPPIGNGIYSVRMKLSKEMPQFMPMHGKRIRLYYRGITKRCTNCFEPHQRKHCKNEKVTWFSYVKRFSELFPEIPLSMYGKWGSMTEKPATESQSKDKMPENWKKKNANSELATELEGNATKTVERVNARDLGKMGESQSRGGDQARMDEEGNVRTDEEELGQLMKSMLDSGISAKTIQKRVQMGSKDEKSKLKALNVGKGRGRGSGRGKAK
jgi:hypothetical protein